MSEKPEQSLKQAWERLNGLIGKYSNEYSIGMLTKEEVVQAVGDLKLENFLFLFVKLNEAKEATEKGFDSERNKILAQAEHDRAFGRLTNHMADYYDAEVSAEHIYWRRKRFVINSVKDYLRQIRT